VETEDSTPTNDEPADAVEFDDGTEGTVEPQRLPGLEGIGLTLERAASWQGPLPPPDALAGYKSILPDMPERLLRMVEKDLDANIEREKAFTDASITAGRVGQAAAIVVTFACVLAAIGFFAAGDAVAGAAFLSLPVVMLVRTLINSGKPAGPQDTDTEAAKSAPAKKDD
jgi:uncharacterized membrane protein